MDQYDWIKACLKRTAGKRNSAKTWQYLDFLKTLSAAKTYGYTESASTSDARRCQRSYCWVTIATVEETAPLNEKSSLRLIMTGNCLSSQQIAQGRRNLRGMLCLSTGDAFWEGGVWRVETTAGVLRRITTVGGLCGLVGSWQYRVNKRVLPTAA